MPKLTVVVPVYNVYDYLGHCIESLKNQTYKDFMVYLVNDGSTDDSLSLCQKACDEDKRFSIIDKTNGGLSDARNAGLKVTNTKYVYFLDSDDFLEPNCFEECINKLEEHDADMVIFDVYQYFMKNNTKEIIANSYDDSKAYKLSEHKEMMTKVLNAAWNKMYRTSLFKDNDITYPFGCYYEDLGTTYRLMLKANKICFVNKPLYNYLADRPGNISQQFNFNVYHVLDMVKINLDYFANQGVYDEYYEELEFLAGVNIIECLKKTRNVTDEKMVSKYIQVCFYFINKNFPQFPKCKYKICRQKYDWIYAHENILRMYLKMRRLKNKGA